MPTAEGACYLTDAEYGSCTLAETGLGYHVGDVRKLQATFRDSAGTLTDPTTVTFKVRAGDGSTTTYLYGTDAQLVKASTGVYYVLWTIASNRRHFYKFTGTGTVAAVEEGEFQPRPSAFA